MWQVGRDRCHPDLLALPHEYLRAPQFADGSRMIAMPAPINLFMQCNRLYVVDQIII